MTAFAQPLPHPDLSNLDRRFAEAMARLGPFETSAHLAIGVSGGADSTALCLLADRWARARGGRVSALIVDHALRAEAADEAQTTAVRLRALGIEATILTWRGVKPSAGIQHAARVARYGLLRDWCRGAGVLHLLCAHHAGDQMETYLMRQTRGGGLGAAGMSAVIEFPEVRLLRPLLSVERADLIHFLKSEGASWVEDPSNANEAFERVRMRQRLAADEGLVEMARAGLAQAGADRIDLERRVAVALAECVSIHPLGFAQLDRGSFRALSDQAAVGMLGRLVQSLGGAEYAPQTARTRALVDRLRSDEDFRGASLGRCRLLAEVGGQVILCRDRRGLPSARAAADLFHIDGWDGRFTIDLPRGLGLEAVVAPLGPDGWRQVPRDLRRECTVPQAAAMTLPALFRGGELVAHGLENGGGGLKMRFRPKNSAAFIGFCIA